MFLFNEAIPVLQKILNLLSTSINVESAIIDDNFKLLMCTKDYLKYKGKEIHTPSMQEVLLHGYTLVNKPGYMPECSGCRFSGHCPSTIEILNTIKCENKSVGVISFTSFTKEGQLRLTENIELYINIIKEISTLIESFFTNTHHHTQFNETNSLINSIIDMSSDSFLTVDNEGMIMHCNSLASKFFSPCSLSNKALQNFFPNIIVDDVLSGNNISCKPFKTNNTTSFISSLPIKTNDSFIGAIIQITQNDLLNSTISLVRNLKINDSLNLIKGNSPEIKLLKEKITKIANSSSTVLISGETGTGKELIARALHYSSNRAAFPFISINCASIPENLLESELFGYDEGGFTGAKRSGKPGRFELANGGTILLDEIGELPKYMQAKLLRVLQERIIERIGGIRSIDIDVRIIAATNQNICEMVEKKDFRADLYYRLNVIPLSICPLRDRKDDIELLAIHFLKKYSKKLNKNIEGFAQDTLTILSSYDWPGNVRELENIIEYATNFETEHIISPQSLPEAFLVNRNSYSLDMKPKVKNVEFKIIKATLDKYGWDVRGKTLAAKELGIGLRTLYRKINLL